MTVTEFTKLDVAGIMFEVVDANRNGYMTNPTVLVTADKNVVRERFGERIVVGFENRTKKTMTIYVKEALK